MQLDKWHRAHLQICTYDMPNWNVIYYLVWILRKMTFWLYVTFCLVTFCLVWILLTFQTDRRTERKQWIWVHSAFAQVCSIIIFFSFFPTRTRHWGDLITNSFDPIEDMCAWFLPSSTQNESVIANYETFPTISSLESIIFQKTQHFLPQKADN